MSHTLPRIYAFDVLKFLGALAIALLHFNWKIIPQGYLFVELFFMIGGFLLYQHLPVYKEHTLTTTLIKRLKDFYFYYILALVLKMILSQSIPSLSQILSSLLFLGDVGLGQRWHYEALWFLGVYLYCYMGYVFLYSRISEKNALNITVALVFITLFAIYTYSPDHALNKTYEMSVGPFQFGLLRGVAGIGMGILIAKMTNLYKEPKSFIYVIGESLSIIIVLHYLFLTATTDYDIINYVLIAIIISSLYLSPNCLNQLLEAIGKKFSYICSLSLPIYIFHCVVINILQKLNYSTNDYPPLLYLLLVVLFAIMMKTIYLFLTILIQKIKRS